MYESYLQSLTTNPLQSSYQVCETFFALHDPASSTSISRKKDYHKYIELYVILQTLFKKCNIECQELELKDDIDHNITMIVEFFKDSKKTLRRALDIENTQELVEKYKSQYESAILKGFSYTFEQHQLQEAKSIITDIQEDIKKTSSLNNIHKARLKGSIDRLEKSLHSSMNNMDRFWGLLFESRLVLKGDPNEVEPILKKIHALSNLFFQVISKSGDELPINIKNFINPQSQDRRNRAAEQKPATQPVNPQPQHKPTPQPPKPKEQHGNGG